MFIYSYSKEKKLIKKILPRSIIAFFRKAIYPERIYLVEDNLNSFFKTYYQKIAAPDLYQKIAVRNAEFKVFSKNGGDGILLYIFSKVGVTDRTFIEMGVEDGRECNTANLSLNFGWKGLLIDANEAGIKSAGAFYNEKLGKMSDNVKTIASFITAENVNRLFLDNGFRDEIDLLSIDIDGNDYWIWKTINAVRPRVVVAEYNDVFGLRPITVRYNSSFHYQNDSYFGASLTALTKLAKEKGYLLIGCDSYGHDAFFVRKDVAEGNFIELSAEEAFYSNPIVLSKIGSADQQFEKIKHLDFDYV